MNAEHINPFIQGAQNILNSVYSEKPSLGKLFLKSAPYNMEPVAISIGIVGELVGDVIFTMQTKVAINLASKLMMGMPVTDMDEMSISAVSELTNMISGSVATLFSSAGKLVDITPPTYWKEPHNIISRMDGNKIVCIPLLFSDNSVFELDINVNTPN